jgi:adenine-specific DNA-methyltransferase
MNNLEKFQQLLKEIFQFDCADLDFGIYRILNYKRKQIEKFINEDLKNKIESSFAKHKDERLENIKQKFEEIKKELKETAEKLGQDPFTPTGELKEEFKNSELGKKYEILKAQKEEAEAIDEIKDSVFNDLYNFFSRYYEEGDFIPQYRYSIKGHKYAIPYNGEELKLYWANADQYYIKTGLLFRDYTFKVEHYKIVFRTVSAKEELGSNKATKQRFFILDDENPIEEKDSEVIVRFQYRELFEGEDIVKIYKQKFKDKNTNIEDKSEEGNNNNKGKKIKQENLNEIIRDQIIKGIKNNTIKLLLQKEYKKDSKGNPVSVLDYHLNRFTAKNTSDFFIHKNLKKFLSEQLDYFIKSEVLDIETIEKEKFLDKHITRAKVVREIGEAIIDFLSQIEDFQKRLWEKKKFVIRTEYVITTDRIPEEFYDEIWKNEKQKKEWEELGFEIPKKKEDLKNSKLPVDTKYFSSEFKEKLLEKLTEEKDLDDLLDGLLIKSENWQALSLLLNKYKEKLQTIYIDPPFNKEQDADYLYNVKYKDSTWISMLENRLRLARDLMKDTGSIFVRCDYNGNMYVRLLMNEVFGEENFRNEITIKRTEGKSRIEGLSYSIATESLFFYAKSDNQFFVIPFRKTDFFNNIQILREKLEKFKNLLEEENRKILIKFLDEVFWIDLDHRPGERTTSSVITVFGKKFKAPDGRHWLYNQKRIDEAVNQGKIRLVCNRCDIPYYSEIDKCQNCKTEDFRVQVFYDKESLTTNWTDVMSYSQSNFWGMKFQTENSEILLKRVIESTSNEGDLVMDFFLGSGTTTAVAHKLKRKWIGVEMGEHFYSVVLPRMKKVLAYDKSGISKEKDVKEKYNENNAGGFFKYQIIEQYEDTLDNIELKEDKKAQELFKDEYLIKYFLDFETKDSPYLLNIEKLKNPFAYKLKVNLSEVGEPQEVIVDIPETFNYLLGIKLRNIKKRKNNGKDYLFILGEKEGQTYAIVWRELSSNEEDVKKDKEFIKKELKDWKPQIVYVNCPENTVLTPDFGNFQAELRYIEPEFKKLMEV